MQLLIMRNDDFFEDYFKLFKTSRVHFGDFYDIFKFKKGGGSVLPCREYRLFLPF